MSYATIVIEFDDRRSPHDMEVVVTNFVTNWTPATVVEYHHEKLTEDAEPRRVEVGDMLYGFCGGHFGRDAYHDKRVEAVGTNWVLARHDDDVLLATGTTIREDLVCYLEPPPEELS